MRDFDKDFDRSWAKAERSHASAEIFFKIWFALIACIAFLIMGATVYVLFHPELIGEFLGRAISGFRGVAP